MPALNFSEINWLAVIVATLAAFMLGGLWYGPLFSKAWVKGHGWTDEQVAAIRAAMSPPRFFGGMVVSYFILAAVIALLATPLGVQTVVNGLCLGGVVWLGVACVTFTHHLASNRSISVYLIDSTFEFIYLLMMGAIIGVWR